MRKKIFFIAILLQVLLQIVAYSNEDEQIILSHLKYLTSNKLEGRLAGSDGADFAAEYIAKKFEEFGLSPLSGKTSYFQEFTFISGVELAQNNKFSITCSKNENIKKISFKLKEEFLPLPFSKSGQISSDIVFVGYGISAPEINYDDYQDVEVKNKIVLMVMHYPKENDESSPFKKLDFPIYANLQYKISKAESKGAAGVIIINDAENHKDAEDNLIELKDITIYGSSGIPAIHTKRKPFLNFLKDCGINIIELEKKISEELKPKSQKLTNIIANMSVDLMKKKSKTKNVIGMLKGEEEKYIIIGAHYDHIGKGEIGSEDIKSKGKIHPGADDNASGISALLQLAYNFSKKWNQKGKSLLFIAFSAEEMGIQGSTYFVNSKLIDLKNILAMINMDMVGRLTNNTLIIGGIETADEFKSIINNINSELNFKFSADGYGPSDHSAFYNKNIPVLFIFTGAHLDHHKPTDTIDKINIAGIKLIVNFLENLINKLKSPELLLTFHKIKSSQPMEIPGKGYGAYLGTIPDFTYNDDGVRVAGVREGSPAQKAGIQEGDVIIQIGEKRIHNLYDLTYVLREHKPGDIIQIKILRKAEEKLFSAELGKR